MNKGFTRLAMALPGLLFNHTNGRLVSAGEKRSYLLYVPANYEPSRPVPLVISLHGYADWPANQMRLSRWKRLADQHGFLVVYPCGIDHPLRWRIRNAGHDDPLQDVRFISDLIDHLGSKYNLDPARIYANGLSNGGGMSFVLACTLSERIAAIGSVAGAYLFPWDDCHPARTMPVILFHGTADPVVPYQGGPSRSFDLPFPAIPNWVAALARRNGCMDPPAELPSQGAVSGVRYSGPDPDAVVVFYTIAGGGHTWPGGGFLPEGFVGPTSREIDATQTMWDFFQEHPLRGK